MYCIMAFFYFLLGEKLKIWKFSHGFQIYNLKYQSWNIYKNHTYIRSLRVCWNDCIYAFLLSWQLVTAGNAFKVTLAQNCMRDLGKKELRRFLFFSISKGYSQKGNLNSKDFLKTLRRWYYTSKRMLGHVLLLKISFTRTYL